jgi:hypothetical protein
MKPLRYHLTLERIPTLSKRVKANKEAPRWWGLKVIEEGLIIWLSGTLLSKCLNAFMGILNTQAYHAKPEAWRSPHPLSLGGKNTHNIDKEGFKGLYWGF